MFYDLNVPHSPHPAVLGHTLALLAHLRYSVVALNHTHCGPLPALLPAPPPPLPPPPPTVTVLSRLTVVLQEPGDTLNLAAAARAFDILAARPLTEKLLHTACTALDIDLVSLDLSQRLPFVLRHSTLAAALARGVCFEICYAAALDDPAARRQLVSNAAALVRATRGRGIVVSSQARRVLDCRGPYDVINLACLWGLKQDRARHAIGLAARAVVLHAETRRNTFKGVIKVVEQGTALKRKAVESNASANTKKSKARKVL